MIELSLDKQQTVWINGIPVFSGTVSKVAAYISGKTDAISVKFRVYSNISDKETNKQIKMFTRRIHKIAGECGMVFDGELTNKVIDGYVFDDDFVGVMRAD